MAKRYGRNQKRQAREQIAKLEDEAAASRVLMSRLQAHNNALRTQVSNARETAANEMLRHLPEVKYAIEHIVDRLVAHYAPELEKAARQLLASGARFRRSPELLRFDAKIPFEPMETLHVRGEIPASIYNVAIGGFR